MAQSKTIQLLRSSALYTPTAAGEGVSAKTALENAKAALTALTGRKDGEIVLARYQETGAEIKSVLGIYHTSPDLGNGQGTEGANVTYTGGWTFIQDQSTVDAILDGLDVNVNYTEGTGGASDSATDSSMVVVAVKQEDGQVAALTAAIKDVLLTGYQEGTDADIAATDTLGQALGKLQAQINAMDLTAVGGGSGDVITTVSEADGKVSATAASLTDVAMTGYSKTSDTGAIAAADTLEQAFSKVENAIAANAVTAGDDSITIGTDGTNGNTTVAVNVKSGEHVLALSSTSGSTGLYTDIAIKKVVASNAGTNEVVGTLGTNVKEAYQLIATDGTQLGQQINIYKDSALKEIYLGDASDSVNSSTGAVTKNAYQLISDPTTKITAAAYEELSDADKALYEPVDGQSLNYVYQLTDGSYSLVPVDVSKFLSESEFGDGLQVVSGVVSVKKDANSGKVRTGDIGLVDVLTVSSNGVKVDNIQAAIDYAVQNATGDLAVSAEGDNYITAGVDAGNNKKINVTADVQTLTATAGTPGTYNASTGAQTTAPTAGTLSGTADSLADGADIATKVKTYVDGAIAIEGARSDAKNTADIKAAVETLDGEALASTAPTAVTYSGTNSDEFQVLTRVNEVDGVIQTVDATANSAGSKSVTLKKVAATGAAADVSIADAGSLITATTVEGALQEIAGNVQNIGVVSNDVIVATEDTSNHNTKLSVTTGNGLEKTGTNNDTLSVKAGDGITVDSNGVAVKAGAGLVINNSSKDVDVNVGNGLEIASDAVKIKLDTTTASHNITSDMLSISSNGLMMSDTWDCGTF